MRTCRFIENSVWFSNKTVNFEMRASEKLEISTEFDILMKLLGISVHYDFRLVLLSMDVALLTRFRLCLGRTRKKCISICTGIERCRGPRRLRVNDRSSLLEAKNN